MGIGLTYVTGADGRRHLTIPEEQRTAIVAFVHDNGEKSAADIAAIVQEGQDQLQQELDGVSEAQARHKPGPDDWSVLELMAHVVTVQRIIANLCENLAQGHLPPGITEEWQEEKVQDGITAARFDTLAEARDASEAAHADLLKFVDTLDGPVATEVTFKHFLFGAMNCRQWPVFQRIHIGDHGPSIGRIKASPGFPA